MIAEKYREKRNAVCIPNFLFVSIQLRVRLNISSGGSVIRIGFGGVGANFGHHHFREAVKITNSLAQFGQGTNHSTYRRKDFIHKFIPSRKHITGDEMTRRFRL